MYKLVFFVPEEYLESVKRAVFNTGAGRLGNYKQCCWQSLGQGQFCPMDEAKPFLGKHNQLQYVAEYKVELVCGDEFIQAAVDALKKAHPYEEPAYEVYKLFDL